jgi:hypothetical protein
MSTYRKADGDDVALLAEVLKTYHAALADAGVTVELLVAHAPRDDAGEPRGDAVKAHGHPAYACVKVNSQRDRVAGLADARVVIDGDRWPELPETLKVAILDHECEHLELKMEESADESGEGAVIALDDCQRPKLKVKPHDWFFGGFDAVAERHHEDSIEWRSLEDANRHWRQLSFGWEKEPAGAA